MAKTNLKVRNVTPTVVTYEGGKAVVQSTGAELARTIATALLFEDTFYERGNDLVDRLAFLAQTVNPVVVSELAIRARKELFIRHAPLWVTRNLALVLNSHFFNAPDVSRNIISYTINQVIQRADELTEFVAMYWKDGKQPLSAQVKKGLAEAFTKFNAYSLAKYNRTDEQIKLRDVLFMVHAKPKDEEQAATWKKLVDGTLESPDTWEVALSAGKDKKEVWVRLMEEEKLGGLAFLRNLRNMAEVDVPKSQIVDYMQALDWTKQKVLPFRFISAARYAPQLEDELGKAMMKSAQAMEKLPGRTLLLVDVSGSMYGAKLSARSELDRIDAATALAILLREIAEDVEVFTFSDDLHVIPNRRAFPLAEAMRSTGHGGTYLAKALKKLPMKSADRTIVITDEQSHDGIIPPESPHAYLVNVAAYAPGLDLYHRWTRINGFSERIVDYLTASESGKWG